MTIDGWLVELRRHVDDPHARRTALAEVEAGLREAADEMGEAAACRAFGDPAEAARTLNAEPVSGTASPGAGSSPRIANPVALDPRTIGSRLADTFNPADSRVLVPKVWGVGWTINLGAVAVRAGLVNPDHLDEDVMGALDRRSLSMASWTASAPALAALALIPIGLGQERLPNHWQGWPGYPTQWVEPGLGQWPLFCLVTAALCLAWIPRLRGASQLWQVLMLLLATNLSSTSLVVCAMQVFGGGRPMGWFAPPAMVVVFGSPLLMGVWLLRTGARRAARARSVPRSPADRNSTRKARP